MNINIDTVGLVLKGFKSIHGVENNFIKTKIFLFH